MFLNDYDYRVNELLEYLMQLFTWHGLSESIPAHEPDLFLDAIGIMIDYNRTRSDYKKVN